MNSKLIAIGIVLVLCSAAAQAEMYKWKDANGVTHYAQLPPDGVDAEMMSIDGKKNDYRRLPRATRPAAEDNPVEEEVESETETQVAMTGEEALEQAEAMAEDERERIAAEEKRICDIATKNLIDLESRPIVRVKEGDDYRVLSADEKAETTTKTKEQIKRYCATR